MTIDAAAIRLTETILGDDGPDLGQTLKAIATNIGVQHIAYAPLSSEKSEDANLFSAICTYSVEWQVRYFKKQYAQIDPVIARGREAVLPFDWNELSRDDPAAQAFFDDAADHDVGRNGLSIPIRNRKGVRSLVSFTSNHSKDDWAEYKSRNIMKLQPMAVLDQLRRAHQFQTDAGSGRTVEKRGGMSDLGGARQDISRHRRASESVVRQRKDLSGYGAPQIELHKLDARGRRRHRNWSHTGESAEMAVLTCAHRRPHFESSFTVLDVAGDDGFGDRVEAASAGHYEAYRPDRGRGRRSEASSLLAALMCFFVARNCPVSAESNIGTLLHK